MSDTTSYTEVRESINCLKSLYDESAKCLINSMRWNENEKILDYGCGTGDFVKKYLFPIAETHKSTVYAADINEKAIVRAKIDCAHECVEYFVGDIMSKDADLVLPFQKVKMNKIISVFVLPYIPETRLLYEPLYDLLQPGGQLGLIYVIGKFYKIAADVANLEKWKGITQKVNLPWAEWIYQDEAEIIGQTEILQACGFVNIVDTTQKYTLKFEKPDQLFEFLTTLHPGLNQIWNSTWDNSTSCAVKKELWQDLFVATKKLFPEVDLNDSPFILDTVTAHRIVSEKLKNIHTQLLNKYIYKYNINKYTL